MRRAGWGRTVLCASDIWRSASILFTSPHHSPITKEIVPGLTGMVALAKIVNLLSMCSLSRGAPAKQRA